MLARIDTPLRRHLTLAALGLVAVVLVLENTTPFRNAQLATMAYLAIAAGGLTVLTGLNGQLSLGHGALMAVGAYTTAVLSSRADAPFPLIGVLLVATVVTLLVGAVVGVAAARLHGPYLAGATLALAIAVPGIPVFFGETLGGEQGITVRPPAAPDWFADAVYFVTGNELTPSRYLAYLGWGALIVAFVLLANLSRGRVGRTWRAVRDDEVAAEIAGIDLGRARVLAFVVSAGCAGLAGALMALAVRVTAPSGFTLTLSLALLSAVVLGGLGSLLGALLGAALITFLPQVVTAIGQDLGLSDVQAAELAPLVYGLTTVLVILLAPTGIVGALRSAWYRRHRRHRRRAIRPTHSDAHSNSPGTEEASR
ncbi:branched-chain amino acid transport system permease protein [Amycolatopsis arida]|uniref:Branched-chain amino acid transport system permease protein n=1 Tax=Amycolatopsis arida TaxID=587909 RepID=A0A1I5MEC4_9PSEU|nr:branched-chain amino acid ABC transporter permease [Amycolatopsis arida]TDX94048.1 branched-chain amino acid transport system permease protein [Amycolatopsis arida]SFP07286.1 branched-chain amino acid transport system permease protein [Amycolatopsis arida]